MGYNKTEYDWQKAVALNPKGDFEHQGQGNTIIRGPIKSLTVNGNDSVVVELEWAAEMPQPGQEGFGTWKVSTKTTFSFPNLVMPYVVEETPEKGDRIRMGTTIFYIERLEGINTLDPTKVEGLKLPTSA